MIKKINILPVACLLILFVACEKEVKHNYSWKLLETEDYRGKQDDITFVNKNTGWYVNGFGKIFRTNDGGKTWKKQLEKKGTFFRTIAFLDKNIGFAGTVGTDYYPNVIDSIPLYGTKDGGKTWNPVDYKGPYVKGLCGMDIVKETIKNKTVYHIYAVGRVGSPANIMVSHDSGKTWQSQSMQADCNMLFDIKMLTKNIGFAAASSHSKIENEGNALILKTMDAGKTWKKVYQSNRTHENSWKIHFPTPKVGYATIQAYKPDGQQRVAKTIDGGNTWTEIDLVKDNTSRQFGIGFIDENHGFVGTYNSGFETKDGGNTWQKVDLGKGCNKIRIYKDEGNRVYGYAIGVNVFKLIDELND